MPVSNTQPCILNNHQSIGSLPVGLYTLVGYLHERKGPVTLDFVKAVVGKGVVTSRPKNNTLQKYFYERCLFYIDTTTIYCMMQAIRGRQGSWVRFGPMSAQCDEALDDEIPDLFDYLDGKFPSGGSFLCIKFLVDKDGQRVIIKWNELREHGVVVEEQKCSYKQRPITSFFRAK